MNDRSDRDRHEPHERAVPLSMIGIAPENLRSSEEADDDIAELAETIAAAGLLYPLLVREGRSKEVQFMALDGRRRLLAMGELVAAGRMDEHFEVRINVFKEKAGQAAAIVVANLQRAPITKTDVIIAIGKLRKAKMTTASIAKSLGYPELEIRRLEALSGLPTEALTALRAGKLTEACAKLLTQVKEPEALERFVGLAVQGWLHGGHLQNYLYEKPTLEDARFILAGECRYVTAGGRFEEDLFQDSPAFVLDEDKLEAAWRARLTPVIESLTSSGIEVFLQQERHYSPPVGYDQLDQRQGLTPAETAAQTKAYEDVEQVENAMETATVMDSPPELLVAFLNARLATYRAIHPQVDAVSISPHEVTGFDIQAYALEEVDQEEPKNGRAGPTDEESEEGDGDDNEYPREVVSTQGSWARVVVPKAQEPEGPTSKSQTALYRDRGTRGLIRSLADDPMVALTVVVARLFCSVALRAYGGNTGASTINGRSLHATSMTQVAALDGSIHDRVEVRRRAFMDSGLRPIPWVEAMAHGEKMELLAELTALSLDVGFEAPNDSRYNARYEAFEIAEQLGHNITDYWTPDRDFFTAHTKSQLLAAVDQMEGDGTVAKTMKKDGLVGYVTTLAAENGWAPEALNMRMVEVGDTIEEDDHPDGDKGRAEAVVDEADPDNPSGATEAPDEGDRQPQAQTDADLAKAA